MNTENSSTGKHWILFTVSTIVLIVFLVLWPQWFWLIIPFPLTFLVQAMRLM